MSAEPAASAVYVDSSALVKLVVAEPESAALRAFLDAQSPLLSCALVRVEVPRAVAPQGASALRRASLVLDRLRLLAIDDALLDEAARISPKIMRSLDAIHLAAAQAIGEELRAVVTYDRRMIHAAETSGIRTIAPV